MDQPKMPTPPPQKDLKGPPPDFIYPSVLLTLEQMELLSDPCVSDEVKWKIKLDNFQANRPIPLESCRKPEDCPRPPMPDDQLEKTYASQIAIYAATKPKWDAEQARKEEIVKEIAAEQKAEKKKVDSGFYKDKGRGR